MWTLGSVVGALGRGCLLLLGIGKNKHKGLRAHCYEIISFLDTISIGLGRVLLALGDVVGALGHGSVFLLGMLCQQKKAA